MNTPVVLFRVAAYLFAGTIVLAAFFPHPPRTNELIVERAQGSGPKPTETIPFLTNVTPTPAPKGSVTYVFNNFNGDGLTITAKLKDKVVKASVKEFGLYDSRRQANNKWYEQAQRDAIAAADARMKTGSVTAESQAELNRKVREAEAHNLRVRSELQKTLNGIHKEYEDRRRQVYVDAGFKLQGEDLVVDIPAMVQRDARRVKPFADALAVEAKTRVYSQKDLVGAVTAWVQTGMRYRIPPSVDGDRRTGGMLTPPQALAAKWGDCDTKTAVAAALLRNWKDVRVLGVAIPKHYLMAVRQVPRKGQVYVQYKGVPYVLIETAGPAWLPPGKVGDQTKAYLRKHRGLKLEKL